MVRKWQPNWKSGTQTNYVKTDKGGFRVIRKPWYRDRPNDVRPPFLCEKHVQVCLISNMAFHRFDGN